MKESKLKGIVLHTYNSFEKDKIIEIFTESLGRMNCLAKNANTTSFKFGGTLDIFNTISCELYKGKSFNIITQCNTISQPKTIRKDYNLINLGLYCIQIIRKSTVFNQPNPNLYSLLSKIFSVISNPNDIHKYQTYFENTYLSIEGLKQNSLPISEENFRELFESYSGKKLNKPRYI